MVPQRRFQKAIPMRFRNAERRTLLLIGDFIVAFIALLGASYYWARGDAWMEFSFEFLTVRPPFWYFLLPFIWLILLIELYDVRHANSWKDTLAGISRAALVLLAVYLVIYFTSEPNSLPRRGVAGFILAATLLTIMWRGLYIQIFTAPALMRRVLLVGGGRAGQAIARVIKKWSRPTIYLVGIIDDDPRKLGTLIEGFKVVGGSDQLHEIIDRECVTDLIVSISGKMQGSMFQALLEAQEAGLEVIRMQKFYEEVMGRTPIQYLEADWILRSFVDHLTVSSFYDLAKRLIDITVALVGALILLATFPFIGLAIVLDSGFPILYAQDRLGKGGQPYRIIKFRTMYQNAESNGPQFTREHDSRITRVGKFLRKSHMDEFPQFINVLRGEMSMVGPRSERPELVKELQKQVPFYRARLLVKPGITGWAQVNFGYADSVEDTAIKIEYDLYYITHRSIVLDLSIMMRTFGTIFGFRGQ